MKTDRYNLVEMAYNMLDIRSGIKYKSWVIPENDKRCLDQAYV
jgi:hypothetical protein